MLHVFKPRLSGPCAKRVVTATLVTPTGERVQSTNFCYNPQKTCPRDAAGYESGEGYHLCEEICDQPAHAEVNALVHATCLFSPAIIKDSTIYVDYTWICGSCKAEAKSYGAEVVLGNPPEET